MTKVITMNAPTGPKAKDATAPTRREPSLTCAALFAFDRGEALSEHSAPFDALVHILDGEAEIKISGKPYRLKTGDAIIMPADEPHALKAITRFKMLLTMIRK